MLKQEIFITKYKCEAIIINFEKIREERQRINNMLAFESLKNNDFKNNINIQSLKRVKIELSMTNDDIFNICKNDFKFCKLLSMIISINSSRQGIKDEDLQIKTCNITSSKYGIILKNLGSNDYRALKNGKIINKKDYINNMILKNDCLKSFDAKINGIINGWIFAKVVLGNGGHQDNVFEEIYVFCDWVINIYNTNNKSEDIFIVLLDTNLTEKYNQLQNKYQNIKNLIIGNHITIQNYFINNYNQIQL